jgi:hypothetical protein
MKYKHIIFALWAATLLVSPLAVKAASWSKTPCRTVITDWSYSGKYGNGVPMAAADYLSARGFGAAIGSMSTINLRSYVAAECRQHPQETVGAAIERLLHTPTSKLPHIPIGGA